MIPLLGYFQPGIYFLSLTVLYRGRIFTVYLLTVFISGRVFPGLVPGRVPGPGPGLLQLGVSVEEHDGHQQHAVHHRQHQPDLANLDRDDDVAFHLLNIYNEPSTPGN